jgi:16S rRNA (cytosine967-C5)-methyltransferase
MPPRTVTEARACAYAVLRRVFEEDAWADRALHGEAGKLRLDPRDRALATQLAYGTVQRLATLDHLIEEIAERPVTDIDAPLLAALRLGAFQILFLDRIPPHAAVGESVELAKANARAGHGLVNAVLRRLAHEGPARLSRLRDATPEEAALRHSHPRWIADMWWESLGPDAARALMEADNRPAEAALRVNTLKTTRDEFLALLPGEPAPDLPEGVLLTGAFDAFGSREWEEGLFMPQSRAAMAVARVLDPQPGDSVLDLCAAPGGKTTHLAALMGNQGRIVAVERHEGRAEALRRTARRMGADIVDVRTANAAEPHEPAAYDRVLVDPPCSDLGTLSSRPDARWRKHAEDPARLAGQQATILRAGLEALKPGGTLVYSTCTISPQENEGVVESVVAGAAGVEVDDLRSDLPVWNHPSVPFFAQTLPHRDGTEGFFIARMRKTA